MEVTIWRFKSKILIFFYKRNRSRYPFGCAQDKTPAPMLANHIGEITSTRQVRCDELDPKGKPLIFSSKGFRTWDLQYGSPKPKSLGHPETQNFQPLPDIRSNFEKKHVISWLLHHSHKLQYHNWLRKIVNLPYTTILCLQYHHWLNSFCGKNAIWCKESLNYQKMISMEVVQHFNVTSTIIQSRIFNKTTQW